MNGDMGRSWRPEEVVAHRLQLERATSEPVREAVGTKANERRLPVRVASDLLGHQIQRGLEHVGRQQGEIVARYLIGKGIPTPPMEGYRLRIAHVHRVDPTGC